tara:strand:- start:6 stop:620 length:615 start_codon:yes stop_codon:yes gene_type:complete
MQPSDEAAKPALRRLFRAKRLRALETEPDLQDRILDQTRLELRRRLQLGELRDAIGLYWPLPGEVDLRPLRADLFADFGLTTALPVADGQGEMTYKLWSGSPLRPDGCNIPAPLDQPGLKAEQLSLLLVPALAVDLMGIRLGYGGGYYDRLRSRDVWGNVPALVVLPGACVSLQPLPADPWDRSFTGWVCENGCQLGGSKSRID